MERNESITEDLRRDILAGVFRPGERLVELTLGDRYECGRTAVRSALVELAVEGLIDREANCGAAVKQIGLAEAIQITEARAALESLIAAQAALHANAADRTELQGIVEQMEAAVANDDTARYTELNSTLHRRIRAISQHVIASHLVENLGNRAAHHEFRVETMPGRSKESLGQHEEIVAAISAGDEPGAAQAMEKHLLSVTDVFKRWDQADN